MTKKEIRKLDSYYKKKYGISWEDRKAMLLRQGGKCALCRKPESHFSKRLAVEHNHRSKKVRSLCCYRCNKFIIGRHDLASATALYNYMMEYDG